MHTPAVTAALSGIWLGALVAIDLIETPAKFSVEGLDRRAAVALGRVVFRRLGFLEIALGAALIPAEWGRGWALGLAVTLWLIALALCLRLRPLLEREMQLRDLAHSKPAPARDSHGTRRLHRLYVIADGTKMLLLIALLFLAARS